MGVAEHRLGNAAIVCLANGVQLGRQSTRAANAPFTLRRTFASSIIALTMQCRRLIVGGMVMGEDAMLLSMPIVGVGKRGRPIKIDRLATSVG